MRYFSLLLTKERMLLMETLSNHTVLYSFRVDYFMMRRFPALQWIMMYPPSHHVTYIMHQPEVAEHVCCGLIFHKDPSWIIHFP